MFKRISTDTWNTLLIIGVILLLLEVVFFNGGLIFSLLVSGLFTFIGWKRYRALWGKILFWIGAVSLVFTILSMFAVRFIIIAVIVLFVRDYFQSRKHPERIQVKLQDETWTEATEPVLEQRFFGAQATPTSSYHWRDINIQGGFGDRVIDLSQTVLPEEEVVISIRHLVGNLVIYIPYDVDVSIHHSAIFGRAAIFHYQKGKIFNHVLMYRSSDYGTRTPRVKIVTSLMSGDLEVKRI